MNKLVMLLIGVSSMVYLCAQEDRPQAAGVHNGDAPQVIMPSERAKVMALQHFRAEAEKDLGKNLQGVVPRFEQVERVAKEAHEGIADLGQAVFGTRGKVTQPKGGTIVEQLQRVVDELGSTKDELAILKRNLKIAATGGVGTVVILVIVRQFVKAALLRSCAVSEEDDDVFDVDTREI
ncbi:hypothetical protein JW872_03570 [Candidatus Babeliales bacterium]|nr:hypothetical protein [Candidatus Babeliales bacterium]